MLGDGDTLQRPRRRQGRLARSLRLVGVILLLSLPIALLFGALRVMTPNDTTPSGDPVSAVNPPDAAAYAEEMGVALDVAAQNLVLQEAAGRLDALLSEHEPATFAGAWIEHSPVFHVVVLLTDPATDIDDDVAATGLEGRIEIRIVEHSLAGLEAEAARILQGEGSRPFDLTIDVFHNRIELSVTSIEALSAYLSEHDLVLSSNAVVVIVDQLARPAAALSADRRAS